MATGTVSSSTRRGKAGKRPTSDAATNGLQDPEVNSAVPSSPTDLAMKKSVKLEPIDDEPPTKKAKEASPFNQKMAVQKVVVKKERKEAAAVSGLGGNTNAHQNKENVNSRQVLAFDWTSEELTQLISNLTACLPKNDNVKYTTLIEKLDWEKVRFSHYSAASCKEKWMQVMTRLRRFRTLTDMVTDAKEWLKHPWSSFGSSKKQKHPEMPKKPLTPYFRYFLEKREKYSREHPDMSMTDLAKLLSKKFQQLPEKKKQKYKESYEKENELYKLELEKFKREHPEEFPPSETRHHNMVQEGPERPQTPFQLFLADRSRKVEFAELDKKEAIEKIRKQWSTLSDGKRVKWIRKAHQEQNRYAMDMGEYCQANPEFKPDQLKPVLSKAEKELKDRYDGKPERPPNSGYSLFSRIMLRELKDVPSKEKMAEISRRWKLLSDPERESYNRQAQKANMKYKERFAAYLNSLPEEERLKLENELKNTSKKKAPNDREVADGKTGDADRLADGKEERSRPKKPLSAMFYFQQEKAPIARQKRPDLSQQEIMRVLAREYNDLPDKKKEKYKKMAEEARRKSEEESASKGSEGNHEVLKKGLFKGEPKKPAASGYGLFSTEMLSVLTQVDPKNRMAEIAKRWNAMANVEKEKYKKRAQHAMQKYARDFKKFQNGLSPAELAMYEEMKSKGSKANRNRNMPVVTVKGSKAGNTQQSKGQQKKEETESDSSQEDSSDEDGDEQSEKSGNDEDGDESGSGSGSGSEESGSDSDDSDEEEDDGAQGEKSDKNDDSSSGDSDSDDSGSGSSNGSSESGSDSDDDDEEEED